MGQLHKRFTVEQVKILLQSYNIDPFFTQTYHPKDTFYPKCQRVRFGSYLATNAKGSRGLAETH
jgi:hypothetical protein